MKNWLRANFVFTRPQTPPQPRSIKQLRSVDLVDPYGEGISLDPVEAERLGMFFESAVDESDFDPDLPMAMRELLGEEK